jgi:hypothetical protein
MKTDTILTFALSCRNGRQAYALFSPHAPFTACD